MGRFALDSATEFLFGHCVHSLDAGLPYPHNLSDTPANILTPEKQVASDLSAALLDAQFAVGQRERLGFVWPLREVFENKTKKPMKVVDAFIEPIVADAIAKNDIRREEKVSEEDEVWLPQALVCILSFVLHGEYHSTEITQIQNH